MSVAAIVEHILKNDLRSTKEVQWNLNFPFSLELLVLTQTVLGSCPSLKSSLAYDQSKGWIRIVVWGKKKNSTWSPTRCMDSFLHYGLRRMAVFTANGKMLICWRESLKTSKIQFAWHRNHFSIDLTVARHCIETTEAQSYRTKGVLSLTSLP